MWCWVCTNKHAQDSKLTGVCLQQHKNVAEHLGQLLHAQTAATSGHCCCHDHNHMAVAKAVSPSIPVSMWGGCFCCSALVMPPYAWHHSKLWVAAEAQLVTAEQRGHDTQPQQCSWHLPDVSYRATPGVGFSGTASIGLIFLSLISSALHCQLSCLAIQCHCSVYG